MYGVSNAPGVGRQMKGAAMIWWPPVAGTLGAEIAAILLMLGLTFYLQSRKTDFL